MGTPAVSPESAQPPAQTATGVGSTLEPVAPQASTPEVSAVVSEEPQIQAKPSGATGTTTTVAHQEGMALRSESSPATPVQSANAASRASSEQAAIEHAAEVLRQIRAELRPGLRHVRVDLDPPELGHLTIRVAMREGRVTAVIQAESATTFELLERQAPELRASLAQNGVEAQDLSIELGSGRSHGEQRGEGQGGQPPSSPHRKQNTGDSPEDAALTQTTDETHRPHAEHGIDTYA